jgi:hypothetical protein
MFDLYAIPMSSSQPESWPTAKKARRLPTPNSRRFNVKQPSGRIVRNESRSPRGCIGRLFSKKNGMRLR